MRERTAEKGADPLPTVVVTGGAGFLGGHITQALLSAGWHCLVVDNLTTGSTESIPAAADFERADVATDAFRSLVQSTRPESIVHLAAQASVPKSLTAPVADAQANVTGTVNVLEAAREVSASVVFASTAAVYGTPIGLPITEDHPLRPLSPYGAAKLAAEEYLKMYVRSLGLRAVALRLANVYGPGQSLSGEGGVVTRFCSRLLQGKPPEFHGDGLQTRDFLFTGDAAGAVLSALAHLQRRQSLPVTAINIGSGSPTTISDLCATIQARMGTDIAPVRLPTREGDIRHSCLDNRLARSLLGWTPHWSLAAGLAELIDSEDRQAAQSIG